MLPLLAKPLHIAFLVLALYSFFIVARLHRSHWDASTFIVAGDYFIDRTKLVVPIIVLPQSFGYDGQFYYRLGLDPFTSQVTAFGVTLDNPAYRMQRIGYPLLAWMLSFWQPWLLAWVMVGLNLAGLFAIAWMSTALALRNGRSAWVGIAPALYPGFIITIERDTTEIVAITFALAVLSFALKCRYWWAAAFAVCAVFTRETTLLYLAGFGVVELFSLVRQRCWSWDLVALAAPAVVFVAWQWTIALLWGVSAYSGGSQNLGPPFAGIARFFVTDTAALLRDGWMSWMFKIHIYWAIAAAMCMLVCALVAFEAMKGSANPGLKISWVFYLALVMCFTTSIWIQPYDFFRGFSDCFVTGATLIMLSRHARSVPVLLSVVTPVWVLTAWLT